MSSSIKKMTEPVEVVISGIAGAFPESDNILELEQNLLKKKNLVTDVNNDDLHDVTDFLREVPFQTGKIKNNADCDLTFFGFGVNSYKAYNPYLKVSLTAATEAICDAGISPDKLHGSRTAVIYLSGVASNELGVNSAKTLSSVKLYILGHARAISANRISFYFNFTGPSYAVYSQGTGCIEAMAAVQHMFDRDEVDNAIIVGANMINSREYNFHMNRLGRLNSDGLTKSFSDTADGFSLSEAVFALLLQKKENALRSYGSIVAAESYFKGSKSSSLIDIAHGTLAPMLKQLYSRANVDPINVAYLEASGCAIKAVDEEELNSIAEVMLPRRKGNLMIGSVKSNLGNCEAISDGVAIVKALITANSGIIPPNINYSTPNSKVPSLIDGKLQVVTEPTPMSGDIIAVNAINFLGYFAHAILKRHGKEKKGLPKRGVVPPDGLPRLFVMTGRDIDKTEQTLKMVENMPIDHEFIGLSHRLFKSGIRRHAYRGYTVLNDEGDRYSEVNKFITGDNTPPVWFVYSGMGSQWPGMGKSLLKHPITAEALHRCHKALKPKGINLIEIITNEDQNIFENILHSFVGITSIQIALTDLMRSVGLEPDGIIGHSVGELGCAYADRCFTAEEAVLCSYARGRASNETELVPGMMAAVGLGYKQILMRKDFPESIEVACHNSETSCTLSGPAEDMKQYIEKLASENIFARLVNVSNIAYHSRYIKAAAPAILRYQKEIVKDSKLRSKKWLSTSVHPDKWDSELAKYCSPEYFTNNLLSSVYFEESSQYMPKDAVIIEVAPHGLLQAILKRSFPAAANIPLTMREHKNGLCFLLAALGKIYTRGVLLDLEKLYPAVEYPVSRGTPSLGWLLNWDLSYVTQGNEYSTTLEQVKAFSNLVEQSQTKNVLYECKGDLENLREFQIKCKSVIPLAAHLVSIIRSFKKLEENNCINLQNIKLKKYVCLNSDSWKLLQSIFKGTRRWLIQDKDLEGEDEVVSGEIHTSLKFRSRSFKTYKSDKILGSTLYQWWKDCGFNLGPSFQLIQHFMETEEGLSVNILWTGNLVMFLEAALTIPCILHRNEPEFHPVSKILSMQLDLSKFSSCENKEIQVMYSKVERVVYCEGLEISNPIVSPLSQDYSESLCRLHTPKFQLYSSPAMNNMNNFLLLVRNIVINNLVEDLTHNKQLYIFESSKALICKEICSTFNNVIGLSQVHIKQFDEQTQLKIGIKNPHLENILVVTSGSSPSNSIYLLKNSKPGFLLLEGQTVPGQLHVVISQEVEGRMYSLCTYKNLEEEHKFISLTSKTCKKEVEDTLKNENNKMAYIVGAFTSAEKIKYVIEEYNCFENINKLRFIFHDLKPEDFDPLYYKDQLQKGLRVNVFHGGKWGFVGLENVQLKTIPECLKLAHGYQFSQLRMKGYKVVAMGLDLTHVNKFAVIDFSAVKNKKNICGIGTIDEECKTIIPDPILQWEKNDNWSHEETVSNLLLYCMAYYVFIKNPYIEVGEKRVSRSILVHRGCLPFCQNIIRVALQKDWEIFTTYESEEEKNLINKLFPEIPESHIAICQPFEFTSKWLLRKKSRILFGHYENGMDIIINTSTNKDMIYSAMEMLKLDGQMFQTNFDSQTDKTTIGMEIFLKKAVVEGLFSSCLLLLSDKEKKLIKDQVQEGIDIGVIKPSSFVTIPDHYSNLEADALLRQSKLLQNERLVVSFKKGNIQPLSTYYLCAPNQAQLIIVRHQSSLWIDMLEWLATRGAKKVHVALAFQPHPFIQNRLLRIMEANPGLEVQFETKCFTSCDSMSQYLKKITDIQSVIIIGEENSRFLNVIGNVYPTIQVISFSQGYNDLFNEKNMNCLQVIDKNLSLLYSKSLLSIIDSLMNNSLRVVFVNDVSSKIISDLRTISLDHMLPCTIQEILAFNQGKDKGYWKEIRTNSIKAKECKEINPVFFVAPIKKGYLNILVKHLFYPAYEAVIPRNLKALTDIAQELFMEMVNISSNAYTLVCCQNNCLLGLQIGKLLEGLGKQVVIIYIDSLIDWKPDDFYQTVLCKVKEAFGKSLFPKLNKKVECALEIFKDRLNLYSQKLPESKTKFKGTFYLITLDPTLNESLWKQINEHCMHPMEIFVAEGNSFLEMISNKDTLSFINSLPVFESSDARPLTLRRTKDFFWKNKAIYIDLTADGCESALIHV